MQNPQGIQVQFRKAERRKAKLRLALIAPSGYGKTFSALRIAQGIGGKVAMIDTENGSGDLYADRFGYDIITMSPPYLAEKYIAAIKAAEAAGYDVLIIDSLSHAWSGEGGLLDRQGKIADSGKANSFTAWRTITPLHNQLVETILASKLHVIATMRAKTEYVVEQNDRGQSVPKKVGLAPIQRDGMEYEFTLVMDVDKNHFGTPSKDRTSLFDGQFVRMDEEVGKKLVEWLDGGGEAAGTPTAPEGQNGPESGASPRGPLTPISAPITLPGEGLGPLPEPPAATAARPKDDWLGLAQACPTRKEADDLLAGMAALGVEPYKIETIRGLLKNRKFADDVAAAAKPYADA